MVSHRRKITCLAAVTKQDRYASGGADNLCSWGLMDDWLR